LLVEVRVRRASFLECEPLFRMSRVLHFGHSRSHDAASASAQLALNGIRLIESEAHTANEVICRGMIQTVAIKMDVVPTPLAGHYRRVHR